jgi:uncharacterized protein
MADKSMWRVGCHLLALSTFIIPLGNVLGPFLLWILKRDEIPEVDIHGRQAINFQLSMTLYFAILFAIAFSGLWYFGRPDDNVFERLLGLQYLGLLPWLVVVADFLFVIRAAIRASSGQSAGYLFAIPFLRAKRPTT